MAITFVDKWAAVGSANPIVQKPAGAAVGDVLLAFVHLDNNSTGVTPPAGWTTLELVTIDTFDRYAVAYHVVDGASPASWDWGSASGGVYWTAACMAYRGVDTVTPVDVEAGSHVITSSLSSPAVTSGGAGHLAVFAFSVAYSAFLSAVSGGFTERGRVSTTVSGSDRVMAVGDAAAPAGSVAARTATTSGSRRTHAQVVVLKVGNQEPNAPILTAPADGATLDRSVGQTFSWTFSDPDAGDSQADAELRHRQTGTTPWTTITGLGVSTSTVIAAGTFADATTYEWQVRTADSLGLWGPWSGSSTFTAEEAPPAPTITDPANLGTINSDPYTVAWSTPVQEAYQVRTVADAAGSPDPATVYEDSGEVVSTTARSRSMPFPVNGRTEHVQVRIRADGLWSPWTSVQITISYTPPAAPTATVTADIPEGAVSIAATHPAPAGSEPTVVAMDIYRRLTADGGDGVLLPGAVGLAPGATHIDWTVASGAAYEYRVRAIGDNGVGSWSPWA